VEALKANAFNLQAAERLRQLLIDYPTLPMQSPWIRLGAGIPGARLTISPSIASKDIAITMANRILLVEDFEDALSVLVRIVQSFGYETIEARTGADAVEKAFFESPILS